MSKTRALALQDGKPTVLRTSSITIEVLHLSNNTSAMKYRHDGMNAFELLGVLEAVKQEQLRHQSKGTITQ